MSRIATGNYDAVIVSHSSFEKLPVSDETFGRFVGKQIEQLEEAIVQRLAIVFRRRVEVVVVGMHAGVLQLHRLARPSACRASCTPRARDSLTRAPPPGPPPLRPFRAGDRQTAPMPKRVEPAWRAARAAARMSSRSSSPCASTLAAWCALSGQSPQYFLQPPVLIDSSVRFASLRFGDAAIALYWLDVLLNTSTTDSAANRLQYASDSGLGHRTSGAGCGGEPGPLWRRTGRRLWLDSGAARA